MLLRWKGRRSIEETSQQQVKKNLSPLNRVVYSQLCLFCGAQRDREKIKGKTNQ